MDLIRLCADAQRAALTLATLGYMQKNKMLEVMAAAIEDRRDDILLKNAEDYALATKSGKDSAFLDRLALNDKRIAEMAEGLRQLIRLEDPIGSTVSEWKMETGIDIKKVRVPIGVIAIIYEARPNVTVDAVGLCIKSGNAVVLKGSKDAHSSNKMLANIMKRALNDNGFDDAVIAFVDDATRESTKELLKLNKYIDVTIPRGGNGLKQFVLENSTMPVIASAGGNCHIYVEKTAKFDMAVNIILNAKCQRPSTCNAVEHLLIDEDIAADFIPLIICALQDKNIIIKGDEKVCALANIRENGENTIILATEEDYFTEYSNLTISIKIVKNCNEAIECINKYSTKHSEAIISENKESVDAFMLGIDSACLYHNVSTRFTDGFQFGFGAEMGISTQKLHVRGPMGLIALTSEKYIIVGNGVVRK